MYCLSGCKTDKLQIIIALEHLPSMFERRNKKNNVYQPVNSSFTILKWSSKRPLSIVSESKGPHGHCLDFSSSTQPYSIPTLILLLFVHALSIFA